MKKKVLVAMSGGVDSSTAAFLLKEQGCEVVGATLRLWRAADNRCRPGGCCSIDEVNDARRVCHALGINHYVLNREKAFKETVVADFINEYLAGRTPNPCIVCNEKIKFSLLLEEARGMGFDYLATGHYAHIDCREEDGRARYSLRAGSDAAKDQTYVLYRLTRKELSSLLLPLGGYAKEEVRSIAERAGLPVARKPDSQEICFVDGSYADFLAAYVPDAANRIKPGPIVDSGGAVLGRHRGLPYYTFGQHRGLGIQSARPLYVVRIDVSSNTLIVGEKDEVYSRRMTVDRLSWIDGIPGPSFPAHVKIRRQHRPASARVTVEGENATVEFDEPQMSITPGQSAVFYKGDAVIGGGLIRS